MKEDLLHYAWRLQRFNRTALQTTTGEPIEILHTGTYNTHAGPDFLHARIRIGDALWAGNVEMHLKASDWLQHGHQEDRAYDNVILHVVMEEDTPVHHARGERIPCLEMKKRIPQKLAAHYLRLLSNEDWIACEQQFPSVSELTRNLWLERLAAERLEQKAHLIAQQLEQNKEDWEETFYHFLARSFGARVNAEPFMMLAQRCPLLLLRKHRHSLFQMEALLFGQSGLLAGPFEEEYPQQLQKEYRFLRRKYKLQPLPPQAWKFLRLRPANFPTLRIAQLCTLLFQTDNLFSKVMAALSMAEVENIFEVKLSNYWWTHYTFDKASEKKRKAMGRDAVHLIFINTIAPFLFLYGQRRGEEKYQERSLELLEATRPESNAVIRRWKAIGATADSAFQTQALLQLKNEYCDRKRCLECAVGNVVLQRE